MPRAAALRPLVLAACLGALTLIGAFPIHVDASMAAAAPAAELGRAPGAPMSHAVHLPGSHRAGDSSIPSSSIPSWPTFLGNDARDSAATAETTLNVSNLPNVTLRWAYALNGSMYSSLAYINGTVFFGAWNGYEYAVNASNGALDWATYLGRSSSCYVGGIDSTPTVWNNTLYVGAGNDHWYALNASSGAVEWRVSVFTTGNFDWASPLVYNGAIYIGLASCSDSPLVQGKLIEVNLSGTHAVLHEFDAVPSGTIGSTIWATPALDRANRTIWVATGNDNGVHQKYAQSIVGLNATTLAVLGFWQVPNVVGQDQDFGATPTLIHDGSGRELIVDTNKNGYAYALNASNVTSNGSWGPVWSLFLGNGPLYAPAAFDGTTLYEAGSSVTIHTTYDDSLRGVDPSTGKAIWTQGSDAGTIYGAPACANGFVIDAAGPDVELRNASSGELVRAYAVPDPHSYGLTIEGSPIIVDGQILFGAGDGYANGGVYDLGLPLGTATLSAPESGRDAPYLANFSAVVHGGIPPYSFLWNFGDGSSGYGSAVSHLYADAGSFPVTVNITDLAGQEDRLNTSVEVFPSLSTAISGGPFGPHIFPLVVGFTAVPVGGSGPPYNLTWSFGDGSSAQYGPAASHSVRLSRIVQREPHHRGLHGGHRSRFRDRHRRPAPPDLDGGGPTGRGRAALRQLLRH